MVGMGSEDDVREFAGDLDLSDPILRISRQTARQTFGIRSPHKVIDATGEEIQRFDTTEYFENLREKMVEEEK